VLLLLGKVHLSRARIVMTAAGLLWLAHIGVILLAGGRLAPVLSDCVQLTLGALVMFSIFDASRRSEGMALSFWRLAFAAYVLLVIAQTCSVICDFIPSNIVACGDILLYSFWFVPLAMALFLDTDHAPGKVDTVAALDFVQAVLVCLAAYLYFFYLPKASIPGELSHEVWVPYFVGHSFVAGAFLLRAYVTRSRDVRNLFGRMGGFLTLSGCVDGLYYYGPGKNLDSGAWFDLFWSALLVVPLVIAATWKQTEAPIRSIEAPRREKGIYSEMFYLLYPLLVLFMSLRIARERLGLAAAIVLFSFICSSARLLVSQTRLVRTQEALRREAARDGLTSLWNRKAILGILERELARSERDQDRVGLIMIDVDHFKAINDTFGHPAGDAVLRIIASGIAAMVRPYDSVGRYGGEEFLIVAPGCGMSETWDLAERVRAHVASCNIIASGGANIRVSLSLGVATGRMSGEIEHLLQTADAFMYQAKNAGRNRVEPSLGRAGAGLSSLPVPSRDFWI
jgi:diguanylate cyclase (GGDEF)-like protein